MLNKACCFSYSDCMLCLIVNSDEAASPPSTSAASIPAHRRALRRDVAQRLLVLPLDAGVRHPGQNQSGAQALVLLRVHAQVAYRRQQKPPAELEIILLLHKSKLQDFLNKQQAAVT